MPLVILAIAAIMIVAAIRGTQGQLFALLGADVPAYMIWAAAIVAIGVIGYVPGLKPVSRGILGLVILVVILKSYKAIIAGFAVTDQIGGGAGTAGGQSGNLAASSGSPAGSTSPPGAGGVILATASNAIGQAGGDLLSSALASMGVGGATPDTSNTFGAGVVSA